MPRVSIRGLARELGLNPGSVHRFVKAGTIEVGPDRLIDVDAAKRALEATRSVQHGYMDEVNERQREKGRIGRGESPARPEAALGPTGALGGGDDPGDPAAASTRTQFNKARTIRETFGASMARLEFQQRSGLLVERALAEKVLFEKARQARDAWLCWPSKTAPLVAAALGLENSDALLVELTAHVHKQIAQLGNADVADFRADSAS